MRQTSPPVVLTYLLTFDQSTVIFIDGQLGMAWRFPQQDKVESKNKIHSLDVLNQKSPPKIIDTVKFESSFAQHNFALILKLRNTERPKPVGHAVKS